MEGFLVSPEFLPAIARLAGRSALGLKGLLRVLSSPSDLPANVKSRRQILEEALKIEDGGVRYVAERLLTSVGNNTSNASKTAHPDEPEIFIKLSEVGRQELSRVVVTGALLVSFRCSALQRAKGNGFLWHINGIRKSDKLVDDGITGLDGVVTDVEYGNPADKDEHRPLSIARVVETSCPLPSRRPGSAETAALAWAEGLCKRYASAVFVSPRNHGVTTRLLKAIGFPLVALSARSGAIRGRLTARLVHLSRHFRDASQEESPAMTQIPIDVLRGTDLQDENAEKSEADTRREEFSNLCIAAASPASPRVMTSSTGEQTRRGRLLLITSRDDIPPGALAVGASVERAENHVVQLKLSGGLSAARYLLSSRYLPQSRLPAKLPTVGQLVVCVLQEGPERGQRVPSLCGSQSRDLDDLLAQQVGLRSIRIPIPGGNTGNAAACCLLAETCGASLHVSAGRNGTYAQVIGTPDDTRAACELIANIRSASGSVHPAVAQALTQGGNARIKEIEKDSGAVRLRVENGNDHHAVHIVGESKSVDKAQQCIRQRFFRSRVTLPFAAVSWLFDVDCGAVKEIEECFSGVSLHICDKDKVAAKETGLGTIGIEVIGPEKVSRKVAEVVESYASPVLRVRVPRRLISPSAGENNIHGLAAIAVKTKTWMELESGGDTRLVEKSGNFIRDVEGTKGYCFASVWGSAVAVSDAEMILDKMDKRLAFGRIHVPRHAVYLVIGRERAELKRIEQVTGVAMRAEIWRDPCVVDVSGERLAVDAAMEKLRRLANPECKQVEVPSQALPHTVGFLGVGLSEVEASTGVRLRLNVVPNQLEKRIGRETSGSHCNAMLEVVGENEPAAAAVEMLQARIANSNSSKRRSTLFQRLDSAESVGPPALEDAESPCTGPKAADQPLLQPLAIQDSRPTRSRSRSRSKTRPPVCNVFRMVRSTTEFPWTWTATIPGGRKPIQLTTEGVSMAGESSVVGSADRATHASLHVGEGFPQGPETDHLTHGRGCLRWKEVPPERFTLSSPRGQPWTWTLPLDAMSPVADDNGTPTAEVIGMTSGPEFSLETPSCPNSGTSSTNRRVDVSAVSANADGTRDGLNANAGLGMLAKKNDVRSVCNEPAPSMPLPPKSGIPLSQLPLQSRSENPHLDVPFLGPAVHAATSSRERHPGAAANNQPTNLQRQDVGPPRKRMRTWECESPASAPSLPAASSDRNEEQKQNPGEDVPIQLRRLIEALETPRPFVERQPTETDIVTKKVLKESVADSTTERWRFVNGGPPVSEGGSAGAPLAVRKENASDRTVVLHQNPDPEKVVPKPHARHPLAARGLLPNVLCDNSGVDLALNPGASLASRVRDRGTESVAQPADAATTNLSLFASGRTADHAFRPALGGEARGGQEKDVRDPSKIDFQLSNQKARTTREAECPETVESIPMQSQRRPPHPDTSAPVPSQFRAEGGSHKMQPCTIPISRCMSRQPSGDGYPPRTIVSEDRHRRENKNAGRQLFDMEGRYPADAPPNTINVATWTRYPSAVLQEAHRRDHAPSSDDTAATVKVLKRNASAPADAKREKRVAFEPKLRPHASSSELKVAKNSGRDSAAMETSASEVEGESTVRLKRSASADMSKPPQSAPRTLAYQQAHVRASGPNTENGSILQGSTKTMRLATSLSTSSRDVDTPLTSRPSTTRPSGWHSVEEVKKNNLDRNKPQGPITLSRLDANHQQRVTSIKVDGLPEPEKADVRQPETEHGGAKKQNSAHGSGRMGFLARFFGKNDTDKVHNFPAETRESAMCLDNAARTRASGSSVVPSDFRLRRLSSTGPLNGQTSKYCGESMA